MYFPCLGSHLTIWLAGSLGLDGCDSGVNVFRDNITSVHQAHSHVLSVSWVALDHLVGWFEHAVGDLRNRQLLVVCNLGRDDRSKGAQREVDTWERNKVGLEGGHVNVEGTIESEGDGDT